MSIEIACRELCKIKSRNLNEDISYELMYTLLVNLNVLINYKFQVLYFAEK